MLHISRNLKALMRKAMNYITKLNPCVTFVPANSSSPNFVTIHSGPTCSSEVGMRGGEQLLYMNAGCFDNGLIVPVHELMHTLGFVHEHNRTLVLAGSWFSISLSRVPQERLEKIQKFRKPLLMFLAGFKIVEEALFNLMQVGIKIACSFSGYPPYALYYYQPELVMGRTGAYCGFLIPSKTMKVSMG